MSTDQIAQHSDEPTDAELIGRVHDGDIAAYADLVERHRDVALRTARAIGGPSVADDLVSEAFERVLSLMLRGKGPRVSFRAYVTTTIRSLHVDLVRRDARHMWVEDVAVLDAAPLVSDGIDDRFETWVIGLAFRELPRRWQEVLWFTSVENLPLTEVAELMDLNANSVAALSFRAREGLRRAYLGAHLAHPDGEACREITPDLPAYARGTLLPRRRKTVQAHLDACPSCERALAELRDISAGLLAMLIPMALPAGAGATGLAVLASQHGSDGADLALSSSTTQAVARPSHVALVSARGRVLLGSAATAAVVTTSLLVLGAQDDGNQRVAPSAAADTEWSASTTSGPMATDPAPVPSTAPLVREPVARKPVARVTPPASTDGVAQPVAPVAPTPIEEPDPTPTTDEQVDTELANPDPAAEEGWTPSAPAPEPEPEPEPEPVVSDLAVGNPASSTFTEAGAPWFHVAAPLTGAPTGTVVHIDLVGVAASAVHTVDGFGDWECDTPSSPGPVARVSCTSLAASDVFAIDVRGDAEMTLTFSAELPDGYVDPTPGDTSATVVLPAP